MNENAEKKYKDLINKKDEEINNLKENLLQVKNELEKEKKNKKDISDLEIKNKQKEITNKILFLENQTASLQKEKDLFEKEKQKFEERKKYIQQKEKNQINDTPMNNQASNNSISQNAIVNNTFGNQPNNKYNNMNVNNNNMMMNMNNINNNMNMNSYNNLNMNSYNNFQRPYNMGNNLNSLNRLNMNTYSFNNNMNNFNNNMNGMNIPNMMNSNLNMNSMNNNINMMNMNNFNNINNPNMNLGNSINYNMNMINNNNINNTINMNNNFNSNLNMNKNIKNNYNINNNNINNLNNNTFPKVNQNNPPNNNQTPALVGLENIGSTCFKNATLQCLSQIGKLSEYFLSEKNLNHIKNNNIAQKNNNELQLSPSYLELIQHLWNKNEPNGRYSPINFMTQLEKMNELFKIGDAGDSKDFIIFILEQLHKELKKPFSNYKPLCNTTLNQYDRKNTYDHFYDGFLKELSIISDLFFGIQETRNECLYCKNKYRQLGQNNPICYNFEIFNLLFIPLEEVKNYRNRNNNFNINNNIVNLDDCFLYNQRTELLTGINKNYCNICQQLYDCNYTTHIFSPPNILILILNRGKNNVYDVKLDFREIFDITKYVYVEMNNKPLLYNLIGVITHIGKSGPAAHFVASCKSSVDNMWYRFNDSFVSKINNVQKDIINFETPYILFYQKSN